METRTDESDRELDQLESKIGGAWVTWAGVGLLLLALGYFLKYAFDREWLSPLVRVLLGTGAGATLYGAGQGILHRGYRRSYGLIFLGFGVATLYTSIGSAYFALDLMGPATGLLAMTAITALAVWSGWQYDNQPMGALALLGALVARPSSRRPGSSSFSGLPTFARWRSEPSPFRCFGPGPGSGPSPGPAYR